MLWYLILSFPQQINTCSAILHAIPNPTNSCCSVMFVFDVGHSLVGKADKRAPLLCPIDVARIQMTGSDM